MALKLHRSATAKPMIYDRSHRMTDPNANVAAIDRSLSETNEWLGELQLLLGRGSREYCFATLRSVLHALRDRLPLIAGARFSAQLPTMLRGVYYEGWQPDRGHVHTRSLAEFLALVDRDAPRGGELAAEERVRAVLRLLETHVDAGETKRLANALPPPVQALFPARIAEEVSSVGPLPPKRVTAPVPTAKTA